MKVQKEILRRVASLTATVAILVAGGACTKVEPERVAPVQREITYQTAQTPQTKAKSIFDTGHKFMSYALYLPDGKNWDSHKAEAGKFFGPSIISYSEGAWRSQGKKSYWPKNGSLSFFAWSANNAYTSLNGGVGIDCTPSNGLTFTGFDSMSNPNADLLVAQIAKDKKANDAAIHYTNGVPTIFHHILSKTHFCFRKTDNPGAYSDGDPSNTTIELVKVEVINFWKKANFTGGGTDAEEWNYVEDPNNVGSSCVLFNGRSALYTSADIASDPSKEIAMERCFIPQHLDDIRKNHDSSERRQVELKLIYNVAHAGGAVETKHAVISFTIDMHNNIWEPGKYYTYTIIIGPNLYPIEFSTDVHDWDEMERSITVGA